LVLAMVSALGLTVRHENIRTEKFEARSAHYFERMGLFKMLGIESGIKIIEHEPAGRFVPLAKISSSEELANVITDIVPLLHLKPADAEPIKYVLSELVRNVFEHSLSTNGAIICAQYYPSKTVRIGIVDAGVGIKKTIDASYSTGSDLEAIRLALMPGVPGTTKRIGGTEYNAGAGLFFIKSIAKVSRDFFVIYSGNAVYKLLRSSASAKSVRLYSDPLDDRHSEHDDMPYWQGTAVGIDIDLKLRKEFSQLLDDIRNIYMKAVIEQKKARHKKPRFI